MATANALRLAVALDLQEAPALAERLLACRGSPIEIDGDAVERLGAQCLQVLLSARATWEADGQPFAITKRSDRMTSTMRLLGVGPADLNCAEG